MRKITGTLTVLLAIVCCTMTVQAAPRTMADGNVFDAAFYAATYPDVAAALGTDEAVLYQHYLLFGKAEGRLPYAQSSTAVTSSLVTLPDGTVFDPVFYAQSYPDVVAVLGNNANTLAQHYWVAGRAEGRKASAGSTVATQQTQQTQDTQQTRQTQQTEITENHTQTGGNYVLNTNTMKFHRPDCRHVNEIRSYNRQDVHDVSRDSVIRAGYTPCKTCNP